MPISQRHIETKHGVISIAETASSGPQVLLIHGNSFSKQFFTKQLESTLGEKYRLVALDLPGHGASNDAPTPETSYTYSGYAEAIREVMSALGRGPSAMFGWSLGGQIGFEMLGSPTELIGLAISGAPSFANNLKHIGEAFPPSDLLNLAGKKTWSKEDAEIYFKNVFDMIPPESWMLDALLRTDGQARSNVFAAAFAFQDHDQRFIAETSPLPLAIINGENDHLIGHDYIRKVNYKNLWRGNVQNIPGAKHAPFWDKPEAFNACLDAFLEDVFSP